MHAETDFRAILVADCGIEHTRVTLVDIVEESEYRLVSQRELETTAEPPLANVTAAIQQGIVELERSTGRQLLEDGRLRIPQSRDGQGLDAFVATCSAGGSLPVLVLAVTADITAQSALLTVEGTYAVPFRVVTIEEVLRDDPLAGAPAEPTREPWWKVVDGLYPGSLLLVGGIDGGNVAPLRTLARSLAEALPPRAARLEQEVARPALPVIYAGNRRAQEVVQQYLAEQVDLRIVDNVRPRLRQVNLIPARQELARVYEERFLQHVPGYEELASWSQSPIQLPYMGLQLLTRFLASYHQRQVLGLDLGSGATAMAWAEGEQCERVVLGSFGLGYGVARILARRGPESIRRWLPFPVTEEEVRTWVLNQALRPRTLPTTVRGFLLQQALAREALAEATAKLRGPGAGGVEMIVASGGGVARAPRLSQAMLVLLDALEPAGENAAGLVDLYLDRFCLVPSVGALATLNPDAAACVLLKDGLFHLGPCLVPLGRGKAGASALSLELEYASGMRQQVEVPWGDVVTVPFRGGEEAHLTVSPMRGTRLGLGRSGEQLTTKGGEMIRGGALGLIVDARGRPLPLPIEDQARWVMLRQWLEQCGAYTAEELASLVPPPAVEEATEAPAEQPAASP
jgi:hypothetical protein